MARIETDPNYTSPTFSRADAATDPFKKEDVQLLAQALSTHTHGGGHGLPVAPMTAGQIPTGLITSAMIADGTIDTVDLKDGAVTSAKILDGTIGTVDIGNGVITTAKMASAAVTAFSGNQGPGGFGGISGSTTSTTGVPSGLTMTMTCTGGLVLVHVCAVLVASVLGAVVTVTLRQDSVGGLIRRMTCPLANTGQSLDLVATFQPSAAAHTFDLWWSVNTGSVTWDSGSTAVVYGYEYKA